jgi:hypothetical protein
MPPDIRGNCNDCQLEAVQPANASAEMRQHHILDGGCPQIPLCNPLLEHHAEHSGYNVDENSHLPADFQMTLQILEWMSKQGCLLGEVNIKMESLCEDVNQHMELVRASLQLGHDKFVDHIDKANADLKKTCDDLQSGISEQFTSFRTFTCASVPGDSSLEVLENYEVDACSRHRQHEGPSRENEGGDHCDSWFAEELSATLAKVPAHGTLQKKANGTCSQKKQQEMHLESAMTPVVATYSCDSGLSLGSLHQHLSMIRFDNQEKDQGYWLRRAIESAAFDLLCAIIIVFNAITIAISAENAISWAVDNPGTEKPRDSMSTMITYLNKFYISFYIVELCLKLWVWRKTFFLGPDAKWNLFDLLLVVSGVYDLIAETTVLSLESLSLGGAGVTWLRILRIMKTLKLLRVIRVMRFFKVLRTIMDSIAGSMNILFWSIIMLGVTLFIFGLCFLQATAGPTGLPTQ